MALACQGDGRGLLRVARFPEYNISLSDAQALRTTAREQDIPFPQALALAAGAEEITLQGKEKIDLLAQHIEDLCHGRSAWKLLTQYLLVRSKYLKPLLSDKSVSGQQRQVALYQFLQFAHSQIGRSHEDNLDPKLSLLRYIRRLEIYGEEKQLRQVPSWADGLDAVRVLTVHASKGLEFKAVYLPALGTTYFPANKKYQPCPPPVGLISGGEHDWHQEEEECLFFVAMSRARDYLCLSRALRYGRVNRKPSKFLPLIAARLPRSVDGTANWHGSDAITDNSSDLELISVPADIPVFPEQQLEVYMKCPRKYLYEFILGLSGKREDSAYVQFHHCVYEVLRHMQSERAAGREVDGATARAYLDEVWKVRGPLDHFYEPIYRQKAEQMIDNALSRTPLPNSRSTQLEHEIMLPRGKIKLTLDYTELVEEGSETLLLVQRIRTGRPTLSEEDKPIYALYQMAAEQSYPQARRQLQILYIATNEIQEVTLSKKQLDTRLTNYDNAITGIRQKRFAPEPSDRECPRCPHYFICPMAEG
jgi:CRISPR/Cas system-associated exonuclease Cas4 (RecB family)